MELLITALLLQTLIIGSVRSGEDYCSRSLGEVCVPCSELCETGNTECNITYYFCPKQCGKSIQATECREACNKNCRNGRCEYTNRIVDLKCIGCEPEYTGKACKEVCPEQCLECHQDTSVCISCKENYTPPDCRDRHYTPHTQITPDDSAPTVYTINCSAECRICNATSGECFECHIGSYGNRCQYSCRHCMESLCGMKQSCFDCISNYSSSGKKCTAEVAMYPSTTSLGTVSCTGEECEQTSGTESRNMLPLIIGLPSTILLTVGIVCLWQRLSKRCHLTCKNRDTRESDVGYPGYIYINDRDLDSYYAGLKNENRTTPPRLSAALYEEMEKKAGHIDDIEHGSSLSSTSDTLFGNLFEVVDRCNEEVDTEDTSSDEYDMHTLSYLTPALTVTGTSKDTSV